eukprot:scaffold226064_cov14-Tisochrysis_lutea.AAC.1
MAVPGIFRRKMSHILGGGSNCKKTVSKRVRACAVCGCLNSGWFWLARGFPCSPTRFVAPL